jgi:hypothetical protein
MARPGLAHAPGSVLRAGLLALLMLGSLPQTSDASASGGSEGTSRPLLWEDVLDAGAIAKSLAVGSDGTRVFVTGSACAGCNDNDYLTVAYDPPTGVQLWVSRYEGPAGNVDEANAMVASPDATRVFVTGTSMNDDFLTDFATVAYDASTGVELWTARYGGPAGTNDNALAITVDPAGTAVYVTGRSMGDGFDYGTVAYDAATGGQLWVARYDGPGGGADTPKAIGVSADGQMVYVTGGSVGSLQDDFATVAYDASIGAQEWVARYDSGQDRSDIATRLGVAPDGSMVYVTGCNRGCFEDGNWVTIAYSSSGQVVWLRSFDGPSHGADVPAALKVSPDGGLVYVGGQITVGGGYDYAVVAYGAGTGLLVWKATRSSRSGDDVPTDLAVAPDGSNVVVTGYWASPSGGGTLAFDGATGRSLWFDIHRQRTPVAVGFSPDSSTVFVTGRVFHPDDAYDTFAYPA